MTDKPIPHPDRIWTWPYGGGISGDYRTTPTRPLDPVGGATGEVFLRATPVREAATDLLEALREGRRAIGDHFAPNDCYATGPLTGDRYRDLVQCPACSFIAMYDAAIAKAKGAA